MTTYGFLATNGSDQVLISSKTKNLHFLGKAAYYSTLDSVDSVGGFRRWVYRIESQSIPVPFFSVPTSDRYAITKMTNVIGYTWEIEIIRSGTSSTRPEVYVFSEINGSMKPSGVWGMQVLNEFNNSISYDSRLHPLVIRGSSQVQPPIKPQNPQPTAADFAPNYYKDNQCSLNNETGMGRFTPNNATSSTIYNTNAIKPIVNYQSVAQTLTMVDETHSWIWRFLFTSTKHIYFSHYWAFYRAAVSVQQSGAHSLINCGWVTISKNCQGDSKKTTNILGLINFYDDRSIS